MGELDPRIRIRAALRCDGIGRLDCAEDTVSGDRLAVRWLPLEANGDAAVKACEKLPTHHALPRILQTGQVGASAFVALDFPDGEMLSARGEERLDNELLLKLAAQLSDALATVHAQGVVHGEMSRDSVLMVEGGKASLWDMPLVIANRLSDRRGENRLMQNLPKTAPYLSPERARGEGASQAGDVYALGAILCVSAGAPLPTAPTTLGVVNLISSGQWVPRVPASLPERWATMLSRMVSVDPAARPSSLEVALAFAHVPGQNSLPTVPELQAVKLPPEIIAAADALMKQQLEAMRAPTREMPLAQVEAQLAIAVPAPLPVASDPMPSLELKPAEPVAALSVQANTLDEVNEPAPDVVRIPTLEIEAVRAEMLAAAPVVETPVVAPSVVMNDSLSVSADLLADGATTLSAEEVATIQANNRKVWMVFGGVVGAAIALIGVVVMLATQAPEPQTAAPMAAVVQPKVAAPVAPRVLEELTPLIKLPVKAAVKNVARPARAAVEAEPVAETPAVVETAPVPAPAPEKSAAADFNFLESAEAPVSELKRPSTEM
ncbi:MAG: protein kinase [Archangium sp.]|nr:protein kinase [Archangium sp.]MDP3152992.1 protein kinase [Archangium sp.]MDP3572620.1 protein kinase [Archangium sp.]